MVFGRDRLNPHLGPTGIDRQRDNSRRDNSEIGSSDPNTTTSTGVGISPYPLSVRVRSQSFPPRSSLFPTERLRFRRTVWLPHATPKFPQAGAQLRQCSEPSWTSQPPFLWKHPILCPNQDEAKGAPGKRKWLVPVIILRVLLWTPPAAMLTYMPLRLRIGAPQRMIE